MYQTKSNIHSYDNHPSSSPSIHTFIHHPSVHQSVHTFVHPSIHLSVHPSICLSFHPFIDPSIHQSKDPCCHPSIYSSIHLTNTNHQSEIHISNIFFFSIFLSIPVKRTLSIHFMYVWGIHATVVVHWIAGQQVE